MIYGMGGTHIEAVRREVSVAIQDVRSSRNGQFAIVMAERIRELDLEGGRIGLLEVDARHKDYMPTNQYLTLTSKLPKTEITFPEGFMHELLVIHSEEELDCVRHAGKLCNDAMHAVLKAAKPSATEQDLRAAAGSTILAGGDRFFTGGKINDVMNDCVPINHHTGGLRFCQKAGKNLPR